MYHKFEKEIKNFLENSLFYEHFVDNSSMLLLDFDKNGLLIFQNMEISNSLKDSLKIKNISFESVQNKLNLSLHCWNIFNSESFLLDKLLKTLNLRKDLKNIEPFIAELKEFIQTKSNDQINEKNQINQELSSLNPVQIVIRAKSGSFKGFYFLTKNLSNSK